MNDLRPLIAEARQLFSMGRADQAESMLLRVVEQHPRELQAVVALGIVAAETGRPDEALQRMRQALSLDPRCVPALCWASLLLLQTNQLDEARRCAELAVSVAPQVSACHVALARCMVYQGMAPQSLAVWKRAMDLNPTDPSVQYDYADALIASREWIKATELLKNATAMAPNPRGMTRLAYLELRLGNIDNAERTCRRILKKDPESAEAHVLMARIFTEQLRLDEAEEHWAKATEIGAMPGFLPREKALSLSAIGRFEEAIEFLKKSLEEKPDQGEAYQAITFAKRVTQEDRPMVKQMEDLLASGKLSPNEQQFLLYSLGKAYDNLGEYERAIDTFNRANETKRRVELIPPFDRVAFKQRIDSSIKMYSEALYANEKIERATSDLPIVIVGMMRSGTTLAEQMLSCHPQIGGAGEQHYWGQHEAAMVDLQRQTFNQSQLKSCARGYVELLTSIAPGYPHVIDKNPANIIGVGSLHLALPNARIIHTRRNAIDTALSIWMTPMNTSAEFICDREAIVDAYKELIRLMDHWRETLPQDRFMEVNYEDLVEAPEVHMPKLVEFCGLEWTDACLHPELNERRVRTPSLWQVRQPVYKTSTDRWKRYEPWLGAFEGLRGLN